MKFKPFSKKYDFCDEKLTESYLPHLHQPLADWFYAIVTRNSMGYNRYTNLNNTITNLDNSFINRLNVLFRQTFPSDVDNFMAKILHDSDLTSNFLALMLQNYAKGQDAARLETILADGGSAFAVTKTDTSANEYQEGVYDLVKRVPDVIKAQSATALGADKLIKQAWDACYSRNPDYEKTVTKSCDALEHLLRDNYEPKNLKPQLGMLLKNLQNSQKKLKFKGDTLLSDKFDLLELISSATTVRGSHSAGTGRKPTPEEAEFILHCTILIWNMHQRV